MLSSKNQPTSFSWQSYYCESEDCLYHFDPRSKYDVHGINESKPTFVGAVRCLIVRLIGMSLLMLFVTAILCRFECFSFSNELPIRTISSVSATMALGCLRLRENRLEFLMRVNEGRFKTVWVKNFFASLFTKTTSPKSTSRVYAGVPLLVIGLLNFFEPNKRKGKGYRLRKRK